MKLPGLTPGEFHLPEKRLKATDCDTDKNAVGTDKKNSVRRRQTRRARINAGGTDKCGGRGKKAYGADKLTPKYHRAPRSMTA